MITVGVTVDITISVRDTVSVTITVTVGASVGIDDVGVDFLVGMITVCLLYTSPSPRD